MMIDAHCHIHEDINGLKECCLRAIENKIYILLNNIEIRNNIDVNNIVNMLQKNSTDELKIYTSIGVHPLDVENIDQNHAKKIIEENINSIIAIGETGLDFSREINRNIQFEFLEFQAELCKKYKKPIVIHARNCLVDDILNTLAPFDIPIMFHSWTMDDSAIKKALNYNTMICFSGMITFKSKTEDIINAAMYCPIERMFLETDSPFLAPVPKRGKTNEPSFVKFNYEKIAQIKNIDLSLLCSIIRINFHSFFNLL